MLIEANVNSQLLLRHICLASALVILSCFQHIAMTLLWLQRLLEDPSMKYIADGVGPIYYGLAAHLWSPTLQMGNASGNS